MGCAERCRRKLKVVEGLRRGLVQPMLMDKCVKDSMPPFLAILIVVMKTFDHNPVFESSLMSRGQAIAEIPPDYRRGSPGFLVVDGSPKCTLGLSGKQYSVIPTASAGASSGDSSSYVVRFGIRKGFRQSAVMIKGCSCPW